MQKAFYETLQNLMSFKKFPCIFLFQFIFQASALSASVRHVEESPSLPCDVQTLILEDRIADLTEKLETYKLQKYMNFLFQFKAIH